MAIVNDAIHAVVEWLETEVTPHFELKKYAAIQDERYDYALVHPQVAAMYTPLSKANKANERFAPGVVVQLMKCAQRPMERSTQLDFRLIIMVFDPGLHEQDVIIGEQSGFEINCDGWNDGVNLADGILRKLRNTAMIGGILRIRTEDGFTMEPWKSDESLVDDYPIFHFMVNFTADLITPSQVDDEINQLL